MDSKARPRVGQLGVRLALAFVMVALAAVTAVIVMGSVSTSSGLNRLLAQQHRSLAAAAAGAARLAYTTHGWDRADLVLVTDLVQHAGAQAQVTDAGGTILAATHAFSPDGPGPRLVRKIIVTGRAVGRVTLAFGKGGLSAAVAQFRASRWTTRISSAGVAVLIALLAALLISPRITDPVERTIVAARARGRGHLGARAGKVRGLGEVKDLASAFDEMAEAREEQDRVRRNLVADVAHELRTPIAILQAGHEAMLDGMTSPTQDNLGSLLDEVYRLTRMVDDLQRLAAAEAAALQLTLAPHDLAEIAASAADSLADSYDAAGITLERRLSGVVASCDPRRMHEIATNLLTNALKFTPQGSVELRTMTERIEGQECAVLRVTDTGVGIPAAELPHVLERFFRGQRTSGMAGSGIGLTIVAELVRAHHGSIAFASEPGKGTEVTVRMPWTAGPVESSGDGPSALSRVRPVPANRSA